MIKCKHRKKEEKSMKKYSNQELKEILENLKNGSLYTGVTKGNYGDGVISYHNGYIRYTHFGSSAVKANIRDLRWLVETIFNECNEITEAVYSEYHVNYIPLNKKYKGIDLSRKHPNTYGL